MSDQAKYLFSVNVLSVFMAALVVVNAHMNNMLYDSVVTFKEQGAHKSSMLLGMNVTENNKFSSSGALVGAVAVGVFAAALAQQQRAGGQISPNVRNFGLAMGFITAIFLVLSGVAAKGIYEEAEAYSSEKAKTDAAKLKDASFYLGVVSGGSVLALYIAAAAMAGGKRVAAYRPRFLGGLNHGMNSLLPSKSMYFTY